MNINIDLKLREYSDRIISDPSNDTAYYERGKLYWKKGMRAEAITDFNSAIAINPQSPAVDYLKMINEIMDFYNTDLYNP